MIQVKSKLSGKYFGALSNKDLNKNREGFQGMSEFCSIWRSSMNKPALLKEKNTGELLYNAFK